MDDERYRGEIVFVGYSREDAEWRRRIGGMLEPLVRERRLDVWSDDLQLVGEGWRPQLADAIDRAAAALLLVSPPFLASEYIMRTELPALVARGIPLVCVLVRACLWDEVPVLADVQWAHDPRRDEPLATSSDPEGQIVRVCKRLLEVVPPGAATRPGSGAERRSVAARRSEAIAPAGEPGALHEVPPLPAGFVARDELDGLREAVLHGADVGITGKALGLHGQGGIGKTVLAAALARDADVRRHFPEGVHWVSVGERPDLVAAQIALLARLGAPHEELRSAAKGVALVRDSLAERQCLLVVDDVWSVAAAQAFAAAGPRGRVLYTTRDASVLRAVGADVRRVDVLPEGAARELLAGLTGVGVDELPAEAELVLAATSRVALALALVGAAIGRGGRGWRDVADDLERGSETFLDHPYANIFKTMQVAVGALDDELAEAYETLAVYPEDTRVPVAAVARHWSRVRDATPARTRADLEALAARELLSLDDDAIAFHDLQREFLLLRAHDLALLHADMLDAYRELLPTGAWSGLPDEEPYILEHLLHHLGGAGDGAEIRRTVCDLAYLARRAFAFGPHAAESDLRAGANAQPDDAMTASRVRLFEQSGHLLAGHRTIGDLATTLASRIGDGEPTLEVAALDALLPDPRLAVRWGLTDAPTALRRVLEGHVGGVNAVAFSPDGRSLASAARDGTVRLWDAATGAHTRTFEGHGSWVTAVVFAPDGRTIASGAGDETVLLWDAATGRQTRTLEGHTGWVNAVAFSPDGRTLASAAYDGTVRLWDAATGAHTGTLDRHAGLVTAVAFSPDGCTVASAASDRTVRLWDAATGAPAYTLEGHTGDVNAVAFSPDGRTLASAADDETVRLWDSTTGAPTRTLEGHTGSVNAVAFSRDGRTLASGAGDRTVRLWDAASGAYIRTLDRHAGWVTAVAFSPDGRTLASAAGDHTVRLWDAATDAHTRTVDGHTDWVNAVAFSPDARTIASAANDETVRLWDAATGAHTRTLEGHTGAVYAVAFSPDRRTLASANDRTVRVWDAATGAPAHTLEGHTGWVNAVAFSPDGRTLASAGLDETIRLWDVATGAPARILEGHADWINAVAFSPDGGTIASVANDETVRLWDAATDTPAHTLIGHTSWVNAVAFSPDGRTIASAADDATVRLWDAVTGAPARTLEGHVGGASAVAFSPDARALASAADDGTVRLWDAVTGAQLCALRLDARVTALAWGSCGIAIAAYSDVILLAVVSRADRG